eukprot:m.64335 g.64335  ORF g.64335 m.64335 type:complete len:638 (+) comp13577_c0_seq3:276-2189(+)
MSEEFDRGHFEDTLKQRFFFAPSFDIYGGTAGLFDYGPVGCAVKANIIDAWRRFFVVSEGMLEIDSPCVTPAHVLAASGHVEKFADVMVKDTQTGECFRADHLLEEVLTKRIADTKQPPTAEAIREMEHDIQMAENFSLEELAAVFAKYKIVSPKGNPLSEPLDFNMMFASRIGPTGDQGAFLRPETAQGIFVNFKRLYDFNNSKLPFAAAQIGTAFRNEIAPRNGLLRAREFQMAEIEHFMDPTCDEHPKFARVADLSLPLLSAKQQLEGGEPVQTTLREAIDSKIVGHQTLAYFMGRIYQFLIHIGIDEKKLRFRQHLEKEMAHYAKDCWDCELYTPYGWVECVGCANRSCFDLEHHAKACNMSMEASVMLPEPVSVDVISPNPNKGMMGKVFKKAMKSICAHLDSLDEAGIVAIETAFAESKEYTLNLDGTDYVLTPEMLSFKRKTIKQHERKFIPSVIEPSFGIGRIVYTLLQHSFRQREEDKKRGWFCLPAHIAPIKVAVLAISKSTPDAPFSEHMQALSQNFIDAGLTCRVDESSAAIGKKYARLDELAIPFAVTYDFNSFTEQTVTVRERNIMQQIRVPVADVVKMLAGLVANVTTWQDQVAKYGLIGEGAAEATAAAPADPPAMKATTV